MRRGALWVAVLALAAGLIVARPLPLHLADTLPVGATQPVDVTILMRTPSDTLQLYYLLWLTREGLTGRVPLFTDPYQFGTPGPRWNPTQAFLPLALPFAALAGAGLHVAYNLLVLLSFPAAGLAAYGLVRHHTGSRAAALVTGVGFALLPARLEPLFGGHPAGFALALVPAVAWGFDRALTGGRLGGGLGGGAALLALAMLEPQYTYLLGVFLAGQTLIRGLSTPAPLQGRARALLAFALLAAGAGAWLLLFRQASVAGSIAETGRSLDEVRLFSPGPGGLLDAARYGGIGLAVLALVGLATGRGRTRAGLRLLYGGAAVLGILLSVGPTLPGLPLFQALHRWVPLFAFIRNPGKLLMLASLGTAVLAGFGAQALLARLGGGTRRRTVAVAGLVGLVLVATPPWHGIAIARYGDSPVYATLRREATRVLYLPLFRGDSAYSSLYLYAVTRTGVPILNGYSPVVPRRYVAEVAEPLQPLNVGDLGSEDAATLRRLGVSHVVVDRAVFPPQASPYPSAETLARLERSPVLALEQTADPLWLFRVTERPWAPAPHLSTPVGVFYEAETLGHQTGAVLPLDDASGGRVVAGVPGGTPGFLVFGPFRPLPAGRYVARFRVRGTGLRVEVTAERGQEVLAARAVDPSPAWADVVLPFTVDRARPLEYRVAWDGRGEAAVDWILIVDAARPDPEWVYEVERLPHRLGERDDAGASGERAGYASPAESLQGDLVTGPARLFPAGAYRLVLQLRTDGAATGPLVRLAVTEPIGRVLASRTVDAAEVAPGGYREVGLDFRLARPTVVEFPIGFLGRTGVFFDRVRVEPR